MKRKFSDCYAWAAFRVLKLFSSQTSLFMAFREGCNSFVMASARE